MLGIIVHGDNHFIVRGRLPSRSEAEALVRHWSVIQIGAKTPPELMPWRISTKEFREDLQWAVVVHGRSAMTGTVARLLEELAARAIRIYDADVDVW